MVGVGFPEAAHSMMRFLPCVMVMLSAELFGGRAMLGGTEIYEIWNYSLHCNTMWMRQGSCSVKTYNSVGKYQIRFNQVSASLFHQFNGC